MPSIVLLWEHACVGSEGTRVLVRTLRGNLGIPESFSMRRKCQLKANKLSFMGPPTGASGCDRLVLASQVRWPGVGAATRDSHCLTFCPGHRIDPRTSSAPVHPRVDLTLGQGHDEHSTWADAVLVRGPGGSGLLVFPLGPRGAPRDVEDGRLLGDELTLVPPQIRPGHDREASSGQLGSGPDCRGPEDLLSCVALTLSLSRTGRIQWRVNLQLWTAAC